MFLTSLYERNYYYYFQAFPLKKSVVTCFINLLCRITATERFSFNTKLFSLEAVVVETKYSNITLTSLQSCSSYVLLNGFSTCRRGRAVKAIDQKSIGLCPRRFESCRRRFFYISIRLNSLFLARLLQNMKKISLNASNLTFYSYRLIFLSSI